MIRDTLYSRFTTEKQSYLLHAQILYLNNVPLEKSSSHFLSLTILHTKSLFASGSTLVFHQFQVVIHRFSPRAPPMTLPKPA